MSNPPTTLNLMAECRFSGRRASLDAIAKTLDQFFGQSGNSLRPARIELRLAETAKPIHPEAAHARLHAVLRQHRIEDLAVSVRPFDSALDLAQGEHLLRLLGTEAAAAPAVASAPPSPKSGPRWCPGWLQRWFVGRSPAAPRVEPSAAAPLHAAAAPSEPELTQAEAAMELRRALHGAVGALEGRTGTVRALRLTVHAPQAHRPLQRLVQHDPNAPQALARLLRSLGLKAVAEPLQVQYRFLPPNRAAATQMAGAGDLKAELFEHSLPEPFSSTAAATAATTTATAASPSVTSATAVPMPLSAAAEATALPQVRQAMVQLRLLGHSHMGAFARPVSVRLKRFPTVLDRATLEGLLRLPEQQAALRSVSNSAPLRIEAGPDGFTLHAPRRPQPGQPEPLVLYHHHQGGDDKVPGPPMPERTALGREPVRLWLNDPRSAANPQAPQQTQPVLWVELSVCEA
ncbi:MAG: hypothetical protein ACK5O3_17080 [Burkholderiales bacterium]|jgi:hypothetical protein